MKLLLCLTIFVSISASAPPSVAEVPQQIFKFNSLIIGRSTMSDAQSVYGKSTPYRLSKEDEATQQICYVHGGSHRIFLIFETGPLGGYKTITGVKVSTSGQKGKCTTTSIDLSALSTANGIHIGQTLADFKKALPLKFKLNGSSLSYEEVSQRQASKDELARLHANWPDEQQLNFDVIVNLQANFQGDALVNFYVSKIESY